MFIIATTVKIGEWKRAIRVLDEADQWSEDFRSARCFSDVLEAKTYKQQPHIISEYWKYLMTACEKSETVFYEVNSNNIC